MRLFLASALVVGLVLVGYFQQPAHTQSPVTGSPVQGVAQYRGTVNSSATITAGNAFQSVLATLIGTSTVRQSLTIENNNAADSCWVFIGPNASATKATSILLTPGGSYQRYFPYVPSDNISATCTNMNDTLYVDTQ
jgi:hypothetical protein